MRNVRDGEGWESRTVAAAGLMAGGVVMAKKHTAERVLSFLVIYFSYFLLYICLVLVLAFG